MQPNYMSMSGYGANPFPLTQPEPIPSWMPAPVAPVQKTFPMVSASAPAFNYETDMAGLMPTSAPLGGSPTNAQIYSDIGGPASQGFFGSIGQWLKDSGALNTRDQQGWAGPALQGAQTLANLYMGMKQYGLAKDQLNFQKDAFNKQYEANRSMTNSRLEDRQARRVLENPNATGVAEYMSKWGVK